MSISRGSTLPAAETAPRCCGTLGQCRVGDWIYPADVFEWWGLTGTRRYQPAGKRPFDPACFDRTLPVWIFERHDHPLVRDGVRHSLRVWRRVG